MSLYPTEFAIKNSHYLLNILPIGRKSILQETIPEYLSCVRGEKRSRVLVKSIADLEEYCSFIDSLSIKYVNFYGHKKAIGELLGVSTNRIGKVRCRAYPDNMVHITVFVKLGEWQRIWAAATTQYNHNKSIQQILKNKENSLVKLLQVMKSAGWQQGKDKPANQTFIRVGSSSWANHETPLKKQRRNLEIEEVCLPF